MLTAAQVPVGAGSAALLGTIPPGAQAALSIPGGTVYLGGSSVTTATGAPVTGYALLPTSPVTSTPSTLWAITASGTASAGVIVATPE